MDEGASGSSPSVLRPIIDTLEAEKPEDLVPYSFSCSMKITTPPSINYYDTNELFLLITPLAFMLTNALLKGLRCSEDMYKIISGKLMMLSLLSISMNTTSPETSNKIGNSYLITMKYIDRSEQLYPRDLPYRETIERKGAIVNKENIRQRYIISYFGTVEVLKYSDELEVEAAINNYVPIIEVLNVDERLTNMLKPNLSLDYISGRKVFTNTMISYPQPADLINELCDNADINNFDKIKILNTLKYIEGLSEKPEVVKKIEDFIPQLEKTLHIKPAKPSILKRLFKK